MRITFLLFMLSYYLVLDSPDAHNSYIYMIKQ